MPPVQRNVEVTMRAGRWALSLSVAGALALALVPASSTFGAGTGAPDAGSVSRAIGAKTLRAGRPVYVRRMRMAPSRFAVADSGRPAQRRRGGPPQGTSITWLMDEPATVRLSIRRVMAAQRLMPVTTQTRHAQTGENAIRFSGRVGRRPLKAGRYRAAISARAVDGRRSATATLTFRIVRP